MNTASKLLSVLGIFSCALTYSCSTPTPFYIDRGKQAIVCCNGIGLRQLTIENDFEKVILENTTSTIYFNDTVRAYKIKALHKQFNKYKLILRANCNYKVVTNDVGADRGLYRILFRTDSLSHVIEASKENCD